MKPKAIEETQLIPMFLSHTGEEEKLGILELKKLPKELPDDNDVLNWM